VHPITRNDFKALVDYLSKKGKSKSPGPAFRFSGKGLSAKEHEALNKIIQRAFEMGKARWLSVWDRSYDPQGLYAENGIQAFFITFTKPELIDLLKKLCET
jgi:hypothetical protein